jgi:hypothetical protein
MLLLDMPPGTSFIIADAGEKYASDMDEKQPVG